MPVPKQITEAANAANELHKKVYAEETPPVETPLEVVAPVAPVVSPEVADLQEQLRKSEARYNSLRGKYEAEFPRYTQEIESLKKQLLAKPQNIDNNTPNDAPPNTDKRLVTSAEVEEYGEEFLDVVKRTAKDEMSSTMTHLTNENQHLRGRIQSLDDESQTNKEDAFYKYLDTHVDNWREVNQDASFVEWLDVVDTFTGSTRADLISTAYSQLNAQRVASFFSAFGESSAAPAEVEPQPTLQDFAAPSNTAQVVTPTEGQLVVYSETEIKKFYDDSRKGLYANRKEEYVKIEADINLAIKEGRVLPEAEIKRRMSM